MSLFEVETAFVGCGQVGAQRVKKGLTERVPAGAMVPEESPTVETYHTDGGDVPEQVSSADLLVATGSVADVGCRKGVRRIGEAVNDDCTLVGLFSGTDSPDELATLPAPFGTIIVLGTDSESQLFDDTVQEFGTDVFTLVGQPMLLHSDYGTIDANLRDGGTAVLCRAVGERNDIETLVQRCQAQPLATTDRKRGRVLFGYAEFGEQFTLNDAERLERELPDPDVVTGQATLGSDERCRLTLLTELVG